MIHGAELVNVTFPGPAYRSLPQALVVSMLGREKPPVDTDMPPKIFREMMSGTARLSPDMVRRTFEASAYERRVPGADGSEYQLEGDLAKPDAFAPVAADLLRGKVYQDRYSPSCQTFCQWQNANPNGTRTPERLEGDGEIPPRKKRIWMSYLAFT